MGYELVEQLNWQYPDAVFYPTGGGVGLIGMWKAFEELEQLGWVTGKRPKMIAIQAAGCSPVARAFDAGESASQMFPNAATFASGLRVPKPYGDYLILNAVRKSGGTVLALSDAEIFASLNDWARHEGILLSPEGAAATAAYDHLIATGFLTPSDRDRPLQHRLRQQVHRRHRQSPRPFADSYITQPPVPLARQIQHRHHRNPDRVDHRQRKPGLRQRHHQRTAAEDAHVPYASPPSALPSASRCSR